MGGISAGAGNGLVASQLFNLSTVSAQPFNFSTCLTAAHSAAQTAAEPVTSLSPPSSIYSKNIYGSVRPFYPHGRTVRYRATASSLLMAARRGVGATRAVGRRTAPDALVAARAVSMQSVWTIRASVSVARRAAPFAVLLVVAMLVKTARAVRTPVSVACRTAMSAFCRHASFPFAEYYSTICTTTVCKQ